MATEETEGVKVEVKIKEIYFMLNTVLKDIHAAFGGIGWGRLAKQTKINLAKLDLWKQNKKTYLKKNWQRTTEVALPNNLMSLHKKYEKNAPFVLSLPTQIIFLYFHKFAQTLQHRWDRAVVTHYIRL